MKRLLAIAVSLLLVACTDSSTAPNDLPDFLAKKGGKPAPVNYALNFTTDYVQIADHDLLDLASTFTLEAWIKPHHVDAAYQHIMSKWNGADASYTLEVNAGHLRTALHDGSANSVVQSVGLLTDNVWQHVAVVFDAGTLRMYVNGVLDNTATGLVTPMNSTQPLTFGQERSSTYTGWYFDGQIDEVRIWNVARSERKITRSQGKSLHGREKGLVGYWRFDEGEGTTAFDATKNSLDGVIGGANWTLDAAPLHGAPQPDTYCLVTRPVSCAQFIVEITSYDPVSEVTWVQMTGTSEFTDFQLDNLGLRFQLEFENGWTAKMIQWLGPGSEGDFSFPVMFHTTGNPSPVGTSYLGWLAWENATATELTCDPATLDCVGRTGMP